jgi:RHS repeat-associated protein
LTQTFDYDSLDRLTNWTQNTTSQGYGYDATGNRTVLTIGATSYPYSTPATSNRLASTAGPAPAKTMTYDAAGNITGNGLSTFTYSDRGRLATAVTGTNTVNYKYNGLEQRVSKTGPGAVVPTGQSIYVYDEQSQLLGEYNASLIANYETVYLGSTPVAVLTQSRTGSTAADYVYTTAVNYAYADQIDTVRAIVRASDHKMRWRWDAADPFGTSAPNQNPAALGTFKYHPRFPGQVYDQETNLHYNVNRDYDPQTGRYVQSDPIGLAGGVNTYGYVDGSPAGRFDPTGEAWGDPLPHGFVDAAAGFGDGISFGITNLIRDGLGTNGVVNRCSRSYSLSHLAGTALPVGGGTGRLAYARTAKAIPSMVRSQSTVARALEGSTLRDQLKRLARGDFTKSSTYKIQDPIARLEVRYKSDAAKMLAATARTSPYFNALGATAIIGGIANEMNAACECEK